MEFFSPGYFSFPDKRNGWLLVHGGAGMSHDYIYVYGTVDGGASWFSQVDPNNSDKTGDPPEHGSLENRYGFFRFSSWLDNL